MWHIDARRNDAEIGIKYALYMLFVRRNPGKSTAAADLAQVLP